MDGATHAKPAIARATQMTHIAPSHSDAIGVKRRTYALRDGATVEPPFAIFKADVNEEHVAIFDTHASTKH